MKLSSLCKGIRFPKPKYPNVPTEVVPIPSPSKVILPMLQHAGLPCIPCVEKGTQVKIGDVVGRPQDETGASVHASVSGEVTDIAQVYTSSGQKSPAVIISSDGKDTWADNIKTDAEYLEKAPSVLIDRIKDAAIMSSGSESAPVITDLTLSQKPRGYHFATGLPIFKPLDTLVINCVDTEPYYGSAHRLMNDFFDDLEAGIKTVKIVTEATRFIMAVDVQHSVSNQVRDLTGQLEVAVRSVDGTRFPTGVHRVLLKELLDLEIPMPYGEPRDYGVSVLKVDSIIDIGRAAKHLKPQVEKVISVFGKGVHDQKLVRVRMGTPLKDVLEACGGLAGRPGKVIFGGPMMGMAQFDLNVPISKDTEAVYVQTMDEVVRSTNHPCINCGLCVKVCPVRLVPSQLSKYCENDQFQDAAALNLMNCIECGCCHYVCPAKRPMVHQFRYGKSQVMVRRMG
ncbi:MAG: RnfABCDGE type electron transport complex subunit C [Deltaproteobacteria bacterium]|nr:RnfABCDGE type electron transport complex subunit C [Deltaproteobacteria bacterium]